MIPLLNVALTASSNEAVSAKSNQAFFQLSQVVSGSSVIESHLDPSVPVS